MAQPWEKYRDQGESGPWSKYQVPAETGPPAPRTKSEWAMQALAGPELALSALSSAAGEPMAGVYGIAANVPGGRTPAEAVEFMRGRAYQPQTWLAQKGQQGLGATLGKIEEGAQEAGGIVTDVTGSPALGATTKSALMMLPSLIPGGRQAIRAFKASRVQPVVQRAQELGYTLEPRQVIGGRPVGGAVKRTAAASGKAAIDAKASLKNQQVTNRLVSEEIGSPNRAMITKADINDLRTTANNSYTKIKANTTKLRVEKDAQFQQAIREAIEEGSDAFTGKGPPRAVLRELQDLLDPKGKQTIGSALEKVESLRSDARVNFKSDKPKKLKLARAQRQAANALEDAIGRALEKGAPDLLAEYQSARQQLARLHNVEDAWIEGGDISAVKLAKLRDNGAPLTGNLEIIADMADYFPSVMMSKTLLGRQAGSGYFSFTEALLTAGLLPLLRSGAQAAAQVRPRPPYRPPPRANPLLQAEAIGSQMSAYNE